MPSCAAAWPGASALLTRYWAAAMAVTVTGFDWTAAALVAVMLAWLTAVVPGAVPGGNWTEIDTCAVVPAGRGENRAKVAVPVAAL